MLATRRWLVPWSARTLRSSLARLNVRVVPSMASVMPCGRVQLSFPFGPSTVTVPPSFLTVTFAGRTIVCLPIRDIVRGMGGRLPDDGEQFAADALFLGLSTGHESARGGENGDAESAEDAGDFVHLDILAASGFAHAFES